MKLLLLSRSTIATYIRKYYVLLLAVSCKLWCEKGGGDSRAMWIKFGRLSMRNDFSDHVSMFFIQNSEDNHSKIDLTPPVVATTVCSPST